MAAQRLIKYFDLGMGKGSYEWTTAMLWVDVLAQVFPPNTNESWLFAPEWAYNDDNTGKKGRCDLVLMQSNANWHTDNQYYGLPFLAAEFKSGGASAQEMKHAKAQLQDVLAFMDWKGWNKGQAIFGMTAAGNLCTFYQWQKGQMANVSIELDIAKAQDVETIGKILKHIKSVSPAVTSKALL